MDEVKEVIHMPKFDAKAADQADDWKQVEISSDVLRELGEYVTGIALMYRKNAFHSFEARRLFRRLLVVPKNASNISVLPNTHRFPFSMPVVSNYCKPSLFRFRMETYDYPLLPLQDVTMSVNKLLRRIVSPEAAAEKMNDMDNNKKLAMHLHDCTYGINSDPMAMFAMTFSALIHDV